MAPAELPVTGVACLLVDDVEAAAGYYRSVLSFEQVALLGGAQPQFAIMRKHGAAVLLQQSPPGAGRPPAGPGGPPWDAIFLVDDVEGEHHQLKIRASTRWAKSAATASAGTASTSGTAAAT